MIFSINNHDYSNRLVAGKYSVMQNPITNNWTDTDGIVHRQKVRDKITGTVSMRFKTFEEYTTFCKRLTRATEENGAVKITLSVNNLENDYEGEFFVSHASTRGRNAFWEDIVNELQVTLEER